MKKYICLLVLILSASMVLAQKKESANAKVTYKGKVVTEEDRKPLPGATVVIDNTSTGTVTDADGQFKITGPKDAILKISFLGYISKAVKPTDPSNVHVVLKSDVQSMDEVVVVGYGTTRKSEMTTAASGIRAKDMVTEGVTSFEQSLQGKLSGVVVINTEGAPGAAMSMEIRGVSSISGSSEPLYVIDGMPIDSDGGMSASQAGRTSTQNSNPMASLNPNDIESIEILKDASATAIYGSRGANGVVLITTKSGKIGKARVGLNYSAGYSKVTRMIDVLSPIEYAEYRNWSQGSVKYSPELMATLDDNPHRWQDVIFRLGKTQEYSASVSGGQKGFTYLFSGNYFNQDGIIINSGFERASVRSNLSIELSPKVKLTSNTNYNRGVYNSVASSTTSGDTNQQGIIKQSLRMDPVIPLNQEVDPDEEGLADNDGSIRNPYIDATEPTRKTVNNRITSNLVLNAQLLKNLTFRPSVGIDYVVSRADSYYPKTTQQGKATGVNDVGFASIGYVETLKWVNENQLTYANTFAKKHALTVTGVFSLEKAVRSTDRSTARGFVTDDLLNNVLQNGLNETYVLNTGKVPNQLMSWTGRVNYNYDKRYMLTASVRADGSSKFGVNNKWAVFPSVSFAWNVMNEKLFRERLDRAKINNLRVRFSWGVVGNQSIPSFQSQSTLGLGWYPSSGGMIPTASVNRLPNPDLKWESTEQINAGLDYGMFNGRFGLNFNYYRKTTKDLLQNVSIPTSSGFARQYQNCGKIRNRGFELEATGKPVQGKNFQWDLSANISWNRNRILDLGGVVEQFTQNLGSGGTVNYSPFIQKVGYPLGTLWGYQVDGIYQRPEDYAGIRESVPHGLNEEDTGDVRIKKMSGEVRIVDRDGNGIIDDDDRMMIGDVNPKYTFGVTSNFTWKRLTLSVMFTGRIGGNIYNHVFSEIESMTGYSNLTRESFYNRWQGEGTSNTYPKLHTITDSKSYYASSFFVEDGTYVRFKNLRLTFAFDKKLFGLSAFPTGSVYFNVDNLYTFTDYRGYDPEVSSFGQNAAQRGIDMGAYPQCRTFSFGVNINF